LEEIGVCRKGTLEFPAYISFRSLDFYQAVLNKLFHVASPDQRRAVDSRRGRRMMHRQFDLGGRDLDDDGEDYYHYDNNEHKDRITARVYDYDNPDSNPYRSICSSSDTRREQAELIRRDNSLYLPLTVANEDNSSSNTSSLSDGVRLRRRRRRRR